MTAENENLHERFRLIFQQHYNNLCNYAFSFVKDRNTSEDIVQEVFVRIWEKRQDIITTDSIRFYLFTAVRNNCITYLGKNRKTVIVSLNDHDVPAEDEYLFVKTKNQGTDYRSLLANAIDELPPKCREVFLLSRFSKQSYKEIAGSLGISVKTVENQIGKALKILRNFLKEKGVTAIIIWLINLLH
ncbi:MAG: RNA polymerase sigma-70 factor [Sphingobacteriales bacterium]|nr:MAG: RNA polymerase sigma-70 factor [Sphingobacteriales bacterium]